MSPPEALSEFESYMKNPGKHNHSCKDFTLCTTALDTSTLRNIMTTVFVVLNFSIIVVGGCFLRERNLLRLRMGHRKVAINHLTSWMTLKGALMYVRHTSQLPGGLAGFSLMMLTGAFAVAHQYLVNLFILPVSMQARCDFNIGIVTRVNQGVPVDYPVSTLPGATSARYAQIQAFLNGGRFGIYETVNNSYANLYPAEEDILGYWNCSTQQNAIINKVNWQSTDSIQSLLQKQGFNFPNASFRGWEFPNDSSINGFLMWSADQPEDSREQWKVRASVATNLQGSGAPDGWTANITNLDCHLVRNVGSDYWIPPIMPSKSTLDEWVPITFGSLMHSPSNCSGVYIEWMLNAMVMVGGSGNYDQRTQMDLPPGANRTYGCSVRGTEIRPEIWPMLIVMILLFALLVIAEVILLIFKYFQRKDIPGGHQAKEMPSGVEHWQLLLLQAMKPDETITFANMGDYSFSWEDTDNKFEIRKPDSAAMATASIDPVPATYRSYSKLNKEISVKKC